MLSTAVKWLQLVPINTAMWLTVSMLISHEKLHDRGSCHHGMMQVCFKGGSACRCEQCYLTGLYSAHQLHCCCMQVAFQGLHQQSHLSTANPEHSSCCIPSEQHYMQHDRCHHAEIVQRACSHTDDHCVKCQGPPLLWACSSRAEVSELRIPT